jgi:hypothetical protein
MSLMDILEDSGTFLLLILKRYPYYLFYRNASWNSILYTKQFEALATAITFQSM